MKILTAPSLKLNTTIIIEVVLLLSVSLAVLFYFSRQALRQESMQDAEQTLEAAVLQVDNVLLNVEQTAGNFYIELSRHLDQPELLYTYCREMVECFPGIDGCAIAFKPDFYPDHELFMAYVHRKEYNSPELITSEMFGKRPYTEQAWYLDPMTTGRACWMNPLKDEDIEKNPIITFSLPITTRDRERVGVFAIDLSVEMLSQIVLASKISPHSYSILLDSDGSFLIHPERQRLYGQTVFSLPAKYTTPTMRAAAEAMVAGKTGHRQFQMEDQEYYVFFKPFIRSLAPGRTQDNLNWSIGIVYPEEDIFAAYNHLLLRVLLITLCGLLIFFLLSRLVIGTQLKPLRKLTTAAQSISNGNFTVKVSKTRRNDEIGQFQQHFKLMQESLVSKVNQQKQLTETLEQHRETLRATYEQVQEDNRVKDDFLKNLTSQIITPTEIIDKSIITLSNDYENISLQDARHEVDTIKQQSETILGLLDQMLRSSKKKTRKEDHHE